MLGNGPQRFLARWRALSAGWPWEDDNASFEGAEKALGPKFLVVFANGDEVVDVDGSRKILEKVGVKKECVRVEEGTHELPVLRPAFCVKIIEEAVGGEVEKTVEEVKK